MIARPGPATDDHRNRRAPRADGEPSSPGAPPIEVVAAVVGRDDRLLLCQRPDGEHLPLLWEFPGGKIDGDEPPREALRRELAEELGVRSDVGEQVADVTHAYPEKTVRIRFFVAVIHGAPRPIIHRDVCWIPIDELGNYEVPPANREVVQMIAERRLSLTAR